MADTEQSRKHHYPFVCPHLCEEKVQMNAAWETILYLGWNKRVYNLVLVLAWHLGINRRILGKK